MLRTIFASALFASSFAQAEVSALIATANKGDAAAQTELAAKYENAEGLARDYARSLELYCRAAKQGNAQAQFRLGWMHANARGVARDDQLAAHWFSLAARQGHEYAQRMMRYMPAISRTPNCLLEPLVERNVILVERHPENVEEILELGLTSPEKAKIIAMVRELAPQYAVDPALALAVIAVESNFKASAISPRNAQGLMQLIPDTARRFQVKNAFHPVDNIKGGLAYLQWLLSFFKGDVALVAAAYNAGERAVEKHRGIPPFRETQTYVRKVKAIYKNSSHPYSPDLTAPSALVR